MATSSTATVHAETKQTFTRHYWNIERLNNNFLTDGASTANSWNSGRNLASSKTRASAVAMQSRPGIDTPHIMYLLCGLRLAATAAVLRVVCYPGTPPSSLPDIRALDGQ